MRPFLLRCESRNRPAQSKGGPLMGGTRKPVPRRPCPQCTPPDSTGTPPPELVGKTCTATLGSGGAICDRQALTVDKFDRPICNAEIWTNVSSHEAGRHGRTPLAPAAQELPHTDAADATDDGRFGTVRICVNRWQFEIVADNSDFGDRFRQSICKASILVAEPACPS